MFATQYDHYRDYEQGHKTMPNWCYNTLFIEGPADRLDEFVAAATLPDADYARELYETEVERIRRWSPDKKIAPFDEWLDARRSDQPLSFAAFVPPPPGADVEWQEENWDTKWDASDAEFTSVDPAELSDGMLTDEVPMVKPRFAASDGAVGPIADDVLRCTFLTAWAPPLPVLWAMAARYRDLAFTLVYAEPGFDFAGYESHFCEGPLHEDVELDAEKAWKPRYM